MKGIGDAFQDIDNDILDDPAFRLSSQHFAVINEFYCLWNIRAQWKMNERLADPLNPQLLRGNASPARVHPG